MNIKNLLFSLLALALLPALAMEPDQAEDNSIWLNIGIKNAIVLNDSTELQAFISAGANVNNVDSSSSGGIFHEVTPLMRAITRDRIHCISILLDEGADLRIAGKFAGNKDTALIRAITEADAKKNRISLLITCSRFFPHPNRQELHDAQRRTRARICALDGIRPPLPRDIKILILTCDKEVWQDACNTPLFLHTTKQNYVTQMPLEVLHTLMRNNALNAEKTIELLSIYKMEQLKPLMLEAAPFAAGPKPDNKEIQPLINPDLLEQNYGQEIRDHMRGVITEYDCSQLECLKPEVQSLEQDKPVAATPRDADDSNPYCQIQ